MDHSGRRRSLSKFMETNGLERVVVVSPENICYLTGAPFVAGGVGKLFFLEKDCAASLIVTDLDYEEVSQRVSGINIIKTDFGERPMERLKKIAGKSGKTGFEEGFLTISSYEAFKTHFDMAPLGGAIEKMREVKDPEELKCIKKAQETADRAFANTLGNLREGMTELEAAAELEYNLRMEGGESLAFETIVGSGYRAVYPHGMPTSKRAENGEAVVFDFGVRICGYCSDTTRTVFFGKPTPEMVRIYDTVYGAQGIALRAARSGMTGKELDKTARSAIDDSGYGRYFVHGLGHGVGLAIHEAPTLGVKSDSTLVPGNVVTIEPGVYVPKVGGVRIEDMIVITHSGCQNLTRSEREMTIV